MLSSDIQTKMIPKVAGKKVEDFMSYKTVELKARKLKDKFSNFIIV